VGTEQILLTVNAGSSSIKIVAYSIASLEHEFELQLSNIGLPNSRLIIIRPGHQRVIKDISCNNHKEASLACLDNLDEEIINRLAVIGYRIVHGGHTFNEPTRLTNEAIAQLKEIKDFDPEHIPISLDLIDIFSEHFPGLTQVACFDTTFYKDMPKLAKLLPLPRKLESLGLKRYGFHGLSYESLLSSFQKRVGGLAANGRIILAHLGSGASLSAVKDGQVLDTTMSFTPASGIPMSSRAGDLDPGIIDFLRKKTDMTIPEFNHMVHFESGLVGVSELSTDMEKLIQESSNNPKAKDAVDLFCYSIKKTIGGFTSILGGLDSLIFSGGIGENAPLIRSEVCSGFDYLGININEDRNLSNEFLISNDNSRVGVHVIHSDEAIIIARQVKHVLGEA
jgi:acetate kinase